MRDRSCNHEGKHRFKQRQDFKTSHSHEFRGSKDRKPNIQVYVLIHDSFGVIIPKRAIISWWKNHIEKEDVFEPITSKDVMLGQKIIDGLPWASMQFARNNPKQPTFIGGAANRKNAFLSALAQMRGEVGLVIINNKLCGFEGYEICNVETNIVHYNKNKQQTTEGHPSHAYSILFLKVPENNLEKIQGIIKVNLKENKTLDQELGYVQVVSFNEAKELLVSYVKLTKKELYEWHRISSCPFGAYSPKQGKRELLIPRKKSKIKKALSLPDNDWLEQGIKDLQQRQSVESSIANHYKNQNRNTYFNLPTKEDFNLHTEENFNLPDEEKVRQDIGNALRNISSSLFTLVC